MFMTTFVDSRQLIIHTLKVCLEVYFFFFEVNSEVSTLMQQVDKK